MTILNIEGQDKYSAGDGIQISPNKVISLLLKESPNLLKLNENGELYCDLQTITNPTVNTVFDTGITTGYVEPSGGWPEAGQILMCKTTTGVHFCILKGDDDKLYYTSDPRDGTSWSHILRDDDLDALMDTLKDYIDEQFEHLEGYVKITSCKGVRESNHYMVKNIYTDADQNGVTLSLYRRDLKGELPNDLISEITFPVADTTHAGIITAEVYNQIQSNTARILALEGVGGYIGVYPTIAERPTNVSQLPAEVIDPKPKDYVKIASDTNFRGQSSIYTITAINSTTGAITWDNGYASVSTLNYRIYDTIAERDAELNVYDGLACFVVATGKKYTYTTNDGWTADVCDYDDLIDRPIVNITGSLDNVLGENNKTIVYNNGDGTRIVVSRAGQTSTQVIERKEGYSTRTTTDEGQTRSAWTNVEFESGIKWDKVIISATEPVDKVVTTPWLDTRDESLNVWNGVRWIKIPNTIQKSQLPTASQSLLNVIYQYVGSTNANYTNGYFYKCVVDDPEADPVTYKWTPIKTQSDEKVLNDLDDVVVENPQDGDGIIYDDDIEKFINVGILDRDKVETAVNLLALGTADDNVYYSDANGSKSTPRKEFYSVKDIDIHEYVGKQWTTHSSHPTTHQARSVCFYNSIGRFISGWNCLSTGGIDEALGGVIPEGAYYCNMSFRKIDNTTMPEIEATIPVQSHNALDQDISVSYDQITDKPYTSYANKQELPNANHRLPTFNFQFDDNNTQDEHVVELFDKYELRCGFACIADNTFITSGAGATRYLGYQKKGYEIISHSTDATAMNTDSATVEAIETKLRTSKKLLVNAGFKVRGWVTPSSTMNDKYIPSLSKFYDFSYTVYNGNMSSQVRCDRTQRLDKLSRINIESNTTSDLKSAIDTTIANNGFLTFYCHSVRLDGGYTNNRAGLEEILAYIRAKMDNLQCYVLTPSEAVDYYFHQRDNETGTAVEEFPTANEENLGRIFQYVGATDANYTNGFFYKCVSDGAVSPTYSRENIDVQIAKTTLVDLEDTTITSPSNGQVLSYNSTSQKWENTTFQGGAIQYNTNSPYKPGYFRVGTQAQYDALSQYYTVQENDTIFMTV